VQTPVSIRSPQKNMRVKAWRSGFDQLASRGFYVLATLPIVLLLVMLGVLIYRSYPILAGSSIWQLLTGQIWSPSKGNYGFLPFIMGSIWVTVVAMILSVPPCLLTAIYLSEYARPYVRNFMKPLLDLLAAIPSVVYGVWGVIAIVPIVHSIAPKLKQLFGDVPFLTSDNSTGYSILAGGFVLAIMVSPFIIAVSLEILHSVPDGYRQASLAVGATHWETVRYAVVPKARTGLMAGVVLGASRAIGETMAVLMVVGNVAKIPSSIFDPAYPLPALIANNYGEMLSIPRYDSALMSAALILLLTVMVINVLAMLILRRITREIAE
jgi:phosphate transport system permease protein